MDVQILAGEMAEPFFSGEQETKLDLKGRTSIPASIRAELKLLDQNSFYAYPSRHAAGVLECCDRTQMNRMKAAMNQLSPMSPVRRKLELAIFSRAREIVFDGDGRTVIPKALRNDAGLETTIYFKGRAETFEIWNEAVYEASKEPIPDLTEEEMAEFDAVWKSSAPGGTSGVG